MKTRFLGKYISLMTFILGAALIILGMNPEVWAKKPGSPGGYDTLCEGSASVTVNGQSLSLNHKIRQGVEAGKDPLRNEFSSTLGSSQFVRIAAPAPGYILSSIVVEVASVPECFPNNITYNFTGDGPPISVDTDDNDGDAYTTSNILPSQETVFNGLKDPLGYGGVAFPTEEGDELVEAVCSFIQDQINTGQTDAATQAAAIGSMAGAMYPDLMRCLATSDLVSFVDENNDPSACNPDDLATAFANTVLANAPELNLVVTSSGDGTYTVLNTANNTSASASFDGTGSCTADGENFEL